MLAVSLEKSFIGPHWASAGLGWRPVEVIGRAQLFFVKVIFFSLSFKSKKDV